MTPLLSLPSSFERHVLLYRYPSVFDANVVEIACDSARLTGRANDTEREYHVATRHFGSGQAVFTIHHASPMCRRVSSDHHSCSGILFSMAFLYTIIDFENGDRVEAGTTKNNPATCRCDIAHRDSFAATQSQRRPKAPCRDHPSTTQAGFVCRKISCTCGSMRV